MCIYTKRIVETVEKIPSFSMIQENYSKQRKTINTKGKKKQIYTNSPSERGKHTLEMERNVNRVRFFFVERMKFGR